MPELPELTIVQEVLNRRILGQTIVSADGIPPGSPIVVRDLTGEGFAQALAGARFDSVMRRGKFLVFALTHTPTDPHTHTPLFMVINPKLTGRLQLCEPKAKKAGPVHTELHLSGGQGLRKSIRRRWSGVCHSAAAGAIAHTCTCRRCKCRR